MITLTHKKIAGFEPRWAPFMGFSFLFDNPGQATERIDEFAKISGSCQFGSDLDLYAQLEATINELDRDLLIRTFLFCPVPAQSYHVTVWDGVNVENITSIPAAMQAEWATFLQGVPSSLRTPPPVMDFITSSTLLKELIEPIHFRFGSLAVWGNQALVAQLCPLDEVSGARLTNLINARKALCNLSMQILRVSPSANYSPHVTLGYFANQEYGKLATTHLVEWSTLFDRNLAASVITFSSLDLYVFTDMANFFKLAN